MSSVCKGAEPSPGLRARIDRPNTRLCCDEMIARRVMQRELGLSDEKVPGRQVTHRLEFAFGAALTAQFVTTRNQAALLVQEGHRHVVYGHNLVARGHVRAVDEGATHAAAVAELEEVNGQCRRRFVSALVGALARSDRAGRDVRTCNRVRLAQLGLSVL